MSSIRNNRRRWIAPWKNAVSKPEIYHALRAGRRAGLFLGEEEREYFRMLMRMCEKWPHAIRGVGEREKGAGGIGAGDHLGYGYGF